MNSVTYTPVNTSLLDIINTSVDYLSIQTLAKQITISYQKDRDFEVLCDVNMILTVIRNLISNAIKYSHNNSTITILVSDWKEDSKYLQVGIQDEGVGMSDEDSKKLFKIEEKIVSSRGTNDESGTGLGLILCKEFIDKHSCRI